MDSAGEDCIELLAAREGRGGARTLHGERRRRGRRQQRGLGREPAMMERGDQHAREGVARPGYRAAIAAQDVAIFADAQVKHGAHAIVADRATAEQVRDVEFFDADAIICTGQRTGDAASVEEIREMRAATSLPLLVGSGATPDNLATLLPLLDRVIVASALKQGGVWWNPVEEARVAAFMERAR